MQNCDLHAFFLYQDRPTCFVNVLSGPCRLDTERMQLFQRIHHAVIALIEGVISGGRSHIESSVRHIVKPIRIAGGQASAFDAAPLAAFGMRRLNLSHGNVALFQKRLCSLKVLPHIGEAEDQIANGQYNKFFAFHIIALFIKNVALFVP